jgi:uncharacterized protein (TIGR03437 family)
MPKIPRIPHFATRAVLILLVIAHVPLHAQSAPGSGWSSFGVLPFRGYDPAIVKTPGRYVLYYTVIPPGDSQNSSNPQGRAFSTDLKTWTIDTGDICATSGDLCLFGPGSPVGTLARISEPIYLPDGRLRALANTGLVNGQVGFSMVSSDGVTWKQEPGYRFTPDPTSVFKVTQLGATSYAYLPDGTLRMYFVAHAVPGSTGTPAWYNNCFGGCGVTLSATSKDYGLTWVQDPGVRINPLVQGPVSVGSSFNNMNVTSVTTTENGKTVYRIYSPSLGDGIVSYVSEDSLNFTLEGRIPAPETDPRAMVLPDGRIWFCIDPDGVLETLVFGPQTFTVGSVRADVGRSPISGFSLPFQSASLNVTGTSAAPVGFSAVIGDSDVQQPFQPQYYSFSPAGGNTSLSTAVNYNGPSTYSDSQLTIHAQAGGAIAVGGIYCMTQALGKPGSSVFCQSAAPALPMNNLSFTLLAGSAPSSQVSNILLSGGNGYPFSLASSVPWATVTATGGIAPLPLTIMVDPSGLTPGAYTGTITITAEGVTELITIKAVVAGGPAIRGIADAASGGTSLASNGFASIYGQGFSGSSINWSPTSALPTSLGGAKVQVGGKDAFISYAGFGQINILLPPDLAPGLSVLTLTTPAGSATSTVNVLPANPQWFTYSVGSAIWIAGLIANTSTLIAPTGIFGAGCCRAAKTGDYIELFANGLGPTSPAAPAGVVLTAAYPIPDLSRVKVTIGGVDAPVLYAGLVGAGLYQLNVLVPTGIGSGDLPVIMTISGQVAKTATLNFQ